MPPRGNNANRGKSKKGKKTVAKGVSAHATMKVAKRTREAMAHSEEGKRLFERGIKPIGAAGPLQIARVVGKPQQRQLDVKILGEKEPISIRRDAKFDIPAGAARNERVPVAIRDKTYVLTDGAVLYAVLTDDEARYFMEKNARLAAVAEENEAVANNFPFRFESGKNVSAALAEAAAALEKAQAAVAKAAAESRLAKATRLRAAELNARGMNLFAGKEAEERRATRAAEKAMGANMEHVARLAKTSAEREAAAATRNRRRMTGLFTRAAAGEFKNDE